MVFDSAPAVSEEEMYETDNQTVYVNGFDSLSLCVHASDSRFGSGRKPAGPVN